MGVKKNGPHHSLTSSRKVATNVKTPSLVRTLPDPCQGWHLVSSTSDLTLCCLSLPPPTHTTTEATKIHWSRPSLAAPHSRISPAARVFTREGSTRSTDSFPRFLCDSSCPWFVHQPTGVSTVLRAQRTTCHQANPTASKISKQKFSAS